jgi:hypothetical protein
MTKKNELHCKNGEGKRKEAAVGKVPHFWKETVLHNTKELADTDISVGADFGPETRKIKETYSLPERCQKERTYDFAKKDNMVNGKT